MESSVTDDDLTCGNLRRQNGKGQEHKCMKTSSSKILFSSAELSILVLGLFSCMTSVTGTITVINQRTNESVVTIFDAPASFVPERVSYYGLRGYAVYANPANACTTVQPTPNVSANVNWILVAKRFDCDFQTKIENAQNMGYSAIIIHNVGSNKTEPMTVKDPERLVIYAAFIGEYNGLLLRDNYSITASNYEYYLTIEDDFSFSGYIYPFAIVVTVCFVIMLLFMVRLVWQQVTRWLQERRRSRRRKLPNSVLKKLPITRWTKGDPYETCAVCLEDFIEQDKVRVLPCSHGFHSVCIDPWLTKNRRVCPICKRKVVLAEERFSDSDSDSEDERTPLLRNPSTSNPNPATSSSTFVQQGDSLFRIRRHPLLHQQGRRGQSRAAPQDPATSTDSSSISSSGSDGHGSRSLRSLPVMAEVHGSSSFGQSTEVPQGSRAPFPSLQTQPPSVFATRSTSLPRDLQAAESTRGLEHATAINVDPVDMDTLSDTDDGSAEVAPPVPPNSIVAGEVDLPAVHIPVTRSTASRNSNPDQTAIV